MNSPHSDKWRDALRKQYQVAIAQKDNTEGVTKVMHMAGFTDSELAELRVTATMRDTEMVPDVEAVRKQLVGTDTPTDPLEMAPADIDDCHTPSVPKPRKKRVKTRVLKGGT